MILNHLKKCFFVEKFFKKIHLKKIFKSNKNIKVINSYGPTEATVSCTSIVFNKTNFINTANHPHHLENQLII